MTSRVWNKIRHVRAAIGRLALSGSLASLALGCAARTSDPAEGPRAEAPLPRTRLPGSRVAMWMPEEMVRPSRAILFRMQSPTVVVTLTEFTATEPGGARAVLEELLGGLHLEDTSPIERGEAKGFLARGRAGVEGIYTQVIGLQSAPAAAAVVVTYEEQGEEVAERIVASVALDPKAALDPLAMSGVTVGDPAGFEVWASLSHPIVLAEADAEPPLPPDAPTLALLTIDYPKPKMTDRELGALLGQLIADLDPDLPKAETEYFDLDGRPAVEVVVPGQRDDTPVMVFGFIARGADSAFGGFGHVGADRGPEVIPRFRRLVRSIVLD